MDFNNLIGNAVGNAVSSAAADGIVKNLKEGVMGEDKKEEQEKKGGFDIGGLVQQACGGSEDKGAIGDVIQKVCGGDDDQGGSNMLEVAKDIGVKVVGGIFK